MPPQKRQSTRQRTTQRTTKAATAKARTPAKTKPRRRATTQPLALADAAIRREPLRAASLPANPLTLLEPIRRAMVDRQVALLGAAMTWNPAHILVSQQAAFWGGFTSEGTKSAPRKRTPAPKRKRAAKH